MSNFLKYVIVILVIVAAFLGYQIYRSQTPSDAVAAPSTQTSTDVAPSPSTTANTPAPTTTTTATNSGKKVDVAAVLNSPASNATEAEKQAYGKLVVDSAVKTNTIDISSCVAQPTVASFVDKSNVTLVNNDSVEHRVVFDVSTFFIVPAKSSKVVKADFGKGPGIYGFGCDQSSKAVGMVFVTTQ